MNGLFLISVDFLIDNFEHLVQRAALIQRRIEMDLLSRTMPGIFIYAVLWPVLFSPAGFHKIEPILCWGMVSVLSL